ncbi:MAG: DJ-1/PfpI family protein [Candidatus Saganbacteria bacterium]|nr:DJ-1/PfpI family protein [Candidatus Saganbacteria bacterium]
MDKQIVMIVAFERFRDEEYVDPKAVFEKAGYNITTTSAKLGTATGKLGMKLKVDITLDQVVVKDYAAVVFVGGPGSFDYHHDPKAHRIAQEAVKEGKILAAVCGAPPILGYAGVLKGKKATMFDDTGDFAKVGAIYTGNGVEIDGKIITATGPSTAKAWGEAIIKALQ